jgi:hypothetical protein
MSLEPKMSELCEFVAVRLIEVPLAQRARLCRSLALIAGDEDQARGLIDEAVQLEAIERKHEQLLLKFPRFPRRCAT